MRMRMRMIRRSRRGNSVDASGAISLQKQHCILLNLAHLHLQPPLQILGYPAKSVFLLLH